MLVILFQIQSFLMQLSACLRQGGSQECDPSLRQAPCKLSSGQAETDETQHFDKLSVITLRLASFGISIALGQVTIKSPPGRTWRTYSDWIKQSDSFIALQKFPFPRLLLKRIRLLQDAAVAVDVRRPAVVFATPGLLPG